MTRPAFVAHAASVIRARLHAASLSSAADAKAALSAAKTLALAPLSAYTCSATSPAQRSSAVYRCTVAGSTEGIATARCDVSTGRCRNWRVSLPVFVPTYFSGS